MQCLAMSTQLLNRLQIIKEKPKNKISFLGFFKLLFSHFSLGSCLISKNSNNYDIEQLTQKRVPKYAVL